MDGILAGQEPKPCHARSRTARRALSHYSTLGMQGIWSRALGLPIERPKSITMTALERKLA